MADQRRILVTGAGGFAGRWAAARIAEALPGAEVVAPPRHGAGALDVADAAAVDALVARVRPTAVLHLAAVSSPVAARAAVRAAWTVNLFGTLNLAEALMRHAPGARFVNAGSSEVYGASFDVAATPLDEAAPLRPRNVYAATKASVDLMLGQMAEAGLRAVRLRPFNHTGPGQSTAFALPAFAAQIAAIERGERAPVLRVGNLEARRDFLDVRDVAEAYLLALLADDLPPGAVLNVASGVSRRIGDALDALLALSRTPISVEPDAALLRPSDLPVTLGDASRARALLGWAPRIPWEATLRDLLDHCRGVA